MRRGWTLALLLALSGSAAPALQDPDAVPFRRVTDESGLEAIWKTFPPNYWVSGLHLVDLDGDGNLDFYCSAHGAGDPTAALGDGHGHFRPAPGTYPKSEIHLAYDLDGDGKLDLCVTYQDGGSRWWLNRSKPGMLEFQPTDITRTTNTARQLAMVDIDRDGKADWLRGARPGVLFDLNDGMGGFKQAAAQLAFPSGQIDQSVIPVDIDGDGNLDLVLEWGRYDFPKGRSRIYRGDGPMHFTDVTAECGLREEAFSIKGVGDFNHDGSPDILALEDMKRLEVYLNDGRGRFTKKPDAIPDQGGGYHYASWGIAVMTDFDNDGRGDVIVNGRNFLKLLRGNGDGTFRYMNRAWGIPDTSKASVDDGLCFGDVENDGRLDVVTYSGSIDAHPAKFELWRNELPQRHWLRVRLVGAAGNRGAEGAKIRLYEPGTKRLLWYEQVATYNRQSVQSYYAQNETERHFGLGDLPRADVSVEFYPSGKKLERKGIAADTIVRLTEDTAR